MSDRISRRQFVKAGTAATVAAGVPALAFEQAPSVLVRKATPPVVISSSNGHEYKNGGPRTCVEEAWQRIAKGEDVLDALIAGVNIVELDPTEMYVGYGGLPNADGVVQLDACCMHGPLKRAGGVAALEGVRTPSRVAKAVLDFTDHHLLVGAGAQGFARNMGFTIEADLNTEASRASSGRGSASGSTGRGEANLYNLSSRMIVEELRRGRSAKDAGMEALKRVEAATVEKRLRDGNGLPSFQLIFYVLTKKGEYAGVSMWSREDKDKAERFAVCTERGPELIACEALHEGAPAE